ncbi:MAG: hypothetical protein VX884_02290 [Pseudomonadota bacterium]|nr:hypothetical protein [Pseudomonadota bacterium]
MPTKQALLLGLGGSVAAALYLSVLAGPAFFLLQYLTQLPLLCVGLVYGFYSLIAASLISIVFTAVADPGLTIVFVLGYVGPVLFIVQRVSLRRRSRTGEEEWYPAGRILAGLTVYGLLVFVIALAWFSGQEGGLAGLIERSLLEVWAAMGSNLPDVSGAQLRPYLFVVPGFLGMSWLIMVVLNGALAQGLMAGFKGSSRPRLALADVSLPNWLACLLVPSMVMLTFGNSGLTFFGGAATLVLLTPFLFQGLGVVHRWVAGVESWRPRSNIRGLLLTGFYVTMLLFQWPIVVTIGIGLADQWLDFRGLRT